ncbi:unnamed protein product [Phyllotreta striolata]|uniref:SUN domain-containing protein n=1 Tax=Phyllotreta striolata TaxID=444603 RepID=A0A9N9TXN4_PHYSR|nr:unnamed protein product [Phyllotreta striolata]
MDVPVTNDEINHTANCGFQLKKLFVDLSGSKISSPEYLLSGLEKSRMSCTGRTCSDICSSGRPATNWQKYCYGIGLLGSLYIILLVIHQGEIIRNLSKRVEYIKQDVDNNVGSDTRLLSLEASLWNMKRNQESMETSLKDLVDNQLAIYSADKTGRTDYAMESLGGRIISTIPHTENVDFAKTFFGITLCEGTNGPKAMLRPDMTPGHCWAFKGHSGGALIQLIGSVRIDAVALEHISERVSPSGEVSSAPKDFAVAGLKSPAGPAKELGRFMYNVFEQQLQTFGVNNEEYYEVHGSLQQK